MSNPYLKHITLEDALKKTGMNICVHADTNVVGRPTMLMRLINKYSIHKARCIVAYGNYLSYDKDIQLSDGDSIDEAEEIVRQADFFHVVRQPVNFGNIDFWKILNSRNCLIQYGGSVLRNGGKALRKLHGYTNILPIVSSDWTIWQQLPGVYHINKIFDVDRVVECPRLHDGDTIKISHCPTNRQIKSTDFFMETMERISKDYNAEAILIEGVSNAECLKLKNATHIHYDSLTMGTFGMTSMESMAMSQAVLCGLNNFAMSVYPDIPLVNITEETFESTIRHLLEHPGDIMEIGARGREWVKRNHDPRTILKQYLYLYDLIVNGSRNINDRDEFLI